MVGVAAAHADAGAEASQLLTHRQTEPSATAGDESDLPGKGSFREHRV
jgi:hypothetical protein